MSKRSRVPTFATHYLTAGGVLMVISDDYVVLVRIRDGFCRRFSHEQLGTKPVADDGGAK